MKLGVFTTITRPYERGDNVDQALACYRELADVVTVIDGAETWPHEFGWKTISEHFQRGYDECDADWVIHADLDFIFHENDFERIRQVCIDNDDQPALSMWKYQFIIPDRYHLKSRLVVLVNKGRFGDRIKFDGGGEADLCQPSLDGRYLRPDDVKEAGIPFYNYEKLTKTRAQIMDDCGRMDRAYHQQFGKYQLSSDGSDESAYQGWLQMMRGRFTKHNNRMEMEGHPKFMQDTIKNLTPDQWGYNGFNELGVTKCYE